MSDQSTNQTSKKPRGFKDTLNLPATPFAMRANLAQNEPQTVARWEAASMYTRIDDARREAGAPTFRFHDGPPYANGSIHVGHLLNKVLKDIVVRSRLMEGMRCPYTPGWDCHGLPIEHRVMIELQEKGKTAKLRRFQRTLVGSRSVGNALATRRSLSSFRRARCEDCSRSPTTTIRISR